MGRGLAILPILESENQEWASLTDLIFTSFDDTTDPAGQLRQAQQLFGQMRKAYRERDAEAFNRASTAFIAALRNLGPELGEYPTATQMNLEVAYNHWVPFEFALAFMVAAVVAILLHMGSDWKLFYFASLTAFAASLAAMLVGFSLRIIISGRAPVSGMYETVICVGLGTAVLGLLFERLYRARIILLAAGVVSTLALIIAVLCPAVLDPRFHLLTPALRSNFWLITHVMTITLSYAAFALAVGIANITLGYFLVRSSNRAAISALTRFTYKAIQVGVLLLASRHHYRRHLGGLCLGPLLGVGLQRSLGSHCVAGLPGCAPRAFRRLGRPTRFGRLVDFLLCPRCHGLVRRQLRYRNRLAHLWNWHGRSGLGVRCGRRGTDLHGHCRFDESRINGLGSGVEGRRDNMAERARVSATALRIC